MIFEALVKISEFENSEVPCPNCSKTDLEKLVSSASFKLKGTGWYETDFKQKPQKQKKKKESSPTTPNPNAAGAGTGTRTDDN